jgi:hypothetical protein
MSKFANARIIFSRILFSVSLGVPATKVSSSKNQVKQKQLQDDDSDSSDEGEASEAEADMDLSEDGEIESSSEEEGNEFFFRDVSRGAEAELAARYEIPAARALVSYSYSIVRNTIS